MSSLTHFYRPEARCLGQLSPWGTLATEGHLFVSLFRELHYYRL